MFAIFSALKNFVKLNIKAINNLIVHDGVEHAGYLAFVSLLSFFPFLVFLMAFTSFIGQSEQGIELINLILENLPEDLTKAIIPRIKEILSGPPSSLLTVSILGIIWTSSSTLEGLRTILNRIYKVETPPAYILRRALSIAQFFIITALMIAATFMFLLLPIIYQKISHIEYLQPLFEYNIEMLAPIWKNARSITFVITLFLGVMYLYYSIPNTKLRLRSLIPGSILVVILWFICGYLLSVYTYRFTQVNLIYGSLAGFITTLLFFYIIHMMFIYGAEINSLLDKNEHKRI
jgi:membrane protein